MKIVKDKTPYGAEVTAFQTKIGRFNFKAHIFDKTGDISYELSLGNKLQRFNNFRSLESWKKSLSQDIERITSTNEFIEKIENHLKTKQNSVSSVPLKSKTEQIDRSL